MLEHQLKCRYDIEKREGACLDTGAPTTVMGLKQALSYCKLMGIKFELNKSQNKFRFGDPRCRSLVTIPITVSVFESRGVPTEVDVVSENVTFLVGLDFLHNHKLFINNISNILYCYKNNESIELL